jgi:ketosteroid isomerase-like protein
MRKLTALLFLATALSLNAVTPDDDVHAAIRNYRQALVKKDIPALEAIWADDYLFINGHGQLRTKADRIADIRSGASSVDSVTHEEEPVVKVHGKTTLVLSRVTIVGKYSGREVSNQFRSLHVWINENGHWRLVFNQLTAIEK